MNLYHYLQFAERLLHRSSLEASEDNISYVAEKLAYADLHFDNSIPKDKWLIKCGIHAICNLLRNNGKNDCSNFCFDNIMSSVSVEDECIFNEMLERSKNIDISQDEEDIIEMKRANHSWKDIAKKVNKDWRTVKLEYKKIMEKMVSDTS
jgi:hypothetical protein